MWLVLCSSTDISALWAWQGLRQLGLAPLELVTTESLACSARWEHRVTSSDTQLRITLADGRVIDSTKIRGVLNRVHVPSDYTVQQAVASDRDYAQAEMNAFYLSWLQGLPGVVINRPVPQGLCGAWLHPSEWTERASRAGLRTCTYRQSAHDTQVQSGYQQCRSFPSTQVHSLIALRSQVFGEPVPRSVAHACSQLVLDANAELLGIDLATDDTGSLTFTNAVPSPDLTIGGVPLLMRLAQILTGERP